MTEIKFAGLELQGYKTFARDTNLVFPARVTAIVGPNGSGKSNVADSIRWVLGEQSYSLLRAKKTEDMIYSGSDNRARAGMASVSIKFDNEGKWLPIDYSEVVLTRRAYRDGKNEYLINNQRVRLKDFNELLGKTGLSDRTYTIIGQGLVDSALSIKPDERSKLFEEAAGIGLYQSRKVEALRRLESTERNLERALDIIAEIKPRVRSLERQAARVSEYKTVQESLKGSLRDWYGYHWFKALRDVNQTQQRLNSAELDRQSARKSIEKEQIVVGNLRSEIDAKRSQVNQLMDQLRELRDQLQQDNQKLAILDERKAAAEKSKIQLMSDLATIEEVIKTGEEKINSRQSEQSKSEQELEAVLKQFESLSAKRGMILEENAALQKEETKLREELLETEKETVVLRSRKQEITDRMQSLQSSQESVKASISNLLVEQEQLQGKTKDLQEKIAQSEEGLQNLKKDLEGLRGEKDDLLKELESQQQSSHKLELEKNRVKNRLELIKQSRESLAGFSAGAKSLLKSSREKKLHNEITDLATHIEVPEEYETAISAALGEAVDVLIVKDGGLGSDLVEDFSSKLEDRVAILSQQDKPHKYRKSRLDLPNGMLWASDIVSVDTDMQAVVQLLLGDFVIVNTMKDAFAGRELHPDLNFVSRAGEVLLSNGIAIIGKGNKSSKVSYSRLVKELSGELEEIESSLESINKVIDKQQEKIEKVDLRQRELNTQIDQKRKDLEKLTTSNKEVSLSFEKVLNRLNWFERQQSDNKNTSDHLNDDLQKIHDAEAKNESKIKELTSRQQELKQKRLQLQPDDIENQFHYLETEKQMLTQSLSHIQQTNQNELRRFEEDKQRKNNFLKRIESEDETIKALDTQISALVEKTSADKSEIDDIQTNTLDPELVSLRELENKNRQFSETDSENQKALTDKDRQVVHYQLELAHQQERLENLKSRIDDDFSLIEMEFRNEYTQSSPLPFPDLVIESLPEIAEIPEGLAELIKEQKSQIRRIGTVNLEADREYQEVKARYENLNLQVKDLTEAISDIEEMVKELDIIMQAEFLETFKKVSAEFTHMFARLFNGGSAKLVLGDEDSPIEGGIEIEARLPGKREQGLVLLSGGERSLTAVALVFALLKVSPTPFCVLDEVDAMLDESNVGRFIELLKDLSEETQFILITHNRNTVSAADVIYGVTMGKDSASQVISLRLDEVDDNFIR